METKGSAPFAATVIGVVLIIGLVALYFSVSSEMDKISAGAVQGELSYGFGASDKPSNSGSVSNLSINNTSVEGVR
jgi:hypothetical protein